MVSGERLGKDDARYISPLIATPGYRHTIGIARVWHFINAYGFIILEFPHFVRWVGEDGGTGFSL